MLGGGGGGGEVVGGGRCLLSATVRSSLIFVFVFFSKLRNDGWGEVGVVVLRVEEVTQLKWMMQLMLQHNGP